MPGRILETRRRRVTVLLAAAWAAFRRTPMNDSTTMLVAVGGRHLYCSALGRSFGLQANRFYPPPHDSDQHDRPVPGVLFVLPRRRAMRRGDHKDGRH